MHEDAPHEVALAGAVAHQPLTLEAEEDLMSTSTVTPLPTKGHVPHASASPWSGTTPEGILSSVEAVKRLLYGLAEVAHANFADDDAREAVMDAVIDQALGEL